MAKFENRENEMSLRKSKIYKEENNFTQLHKFRKYMLCKLSAGDASSLPR